MKKPTVDEHAEPQFVPPDERRTQGKALREAVPREAHGHWKAPKGRRDIVDLLNESNAGRMPQLVPIRFGRMMQSPFTFYRGSAVIMAADLASTPTPGLRVQACGDAHLMNFGGFATPERSIVFDINDFDETLPAPWEWDVKRPGGQRGRRRPPASACSTAMRRAAAGHACCSYREHMADYASMRALDVWYDRIDIDRFLSAAIRRRGGAGQESGSRMSRKRTCRNSCSPSSPSITATTPRIKDDPPLIFHPTAEQAPGVESGYARSARALPRIAGRAPSRAVRPLPALRLGDEGRRRRQRRHHCGVALFMASDDDPIFLQVKEANASVLEPYAGKSLHGNHGERVVAASA